jgi:hypothetical protein
MSSSRSKWETSAWTGDCRVFLLVITVQKEALDETQTESEISLIDTSGEKGSSVASREVEAIVE